MNIRFSLRIYVFSAVIVLAFGLAVICFGLVSNYFIKGLDTVVKISMIEIADKADPEKDRANNLIGFHIASKWEDLPDEITDNISTKPQQGEFKKFIKQKGPFERPEYAYFATLVVDSQGQTEFVARMINMRDARRFSETPKDFLVGILAFGCGIAVIFSLIMLLMMRSINAPMDALSNWTKGLRRETLKDEIPSFRYKELNNFAEVIRSSLLSSQRSLDRETKFLQHASHELRTPISVIGNSVELLNRITNKDDIKQTEVIKRIERACMTMAGLTQTLLWLSRDEEIPVANNIALDVAISEYVEELSYLLAGKDGVMVKVHAPSNNIVLPEEPCRIILSNLIRNAFQHTHAGEISIDQTGNRFTLRNPMSDQNVGERDDIGFGLGLHLSRQIAKRFNWQLTTSSDKGVFKVIVEF